MTKQISYIRAIGADAVIISPISSRSKDCSAPGVMDHTAIDNRYGDMDVFNEFLQKAKRIGKGTLVYLMKALMLFPGRLTIKLPGNNS